MTLYLIPFLSFIKTFKNIARIQIANPKMRNPQTNPRMRIRELIRIQMWPKIRRIAIPKIDNSMSNLRPVFLTGDY